MLFLFQGCLSPSTRNGLAHQGASPSNGRPLVKSSSKKRRTSSNLKENSRFTSVLWLSNSTQSGKNARKTDIFREFSLTLKGPNRLGKIQKLSLTVGRERVRFGKRRPRSPR